MKRVTSYLGCLIFLLGVSATSLLNIQSAEARPNRDTSTQVIRTNRRRIRRANIKRANLKRANIKRARIIRRAQIKRAKIRNRNRGRHPYIVRRRIRRAPTKHRVVHRYRRYNGYPRRTTVIVPRYIYRDRDYYRDPYRGYLWGSLAIGLVRDMIRSQQRQTNTVIYQYTPGGTYLALPSSALESYANPILEEHDLRTSRCTSNSVVLLLPNQQVVCAYPNSDVRAGLYEVHPETWDLAKVYR